MPKISKPLKRNIELNIAEKNDEHNKSSPKSILDEASMCDFQDSFYEYINGLPFKTFDELKAGLDALDADAFEIFPPEWLEPLKPIFNIKESDIIFREEGIIHTLAFLCFTNQCNMPLYLVKIQEYRLNFFEYLVYFICKCSQLSEPGFELFKAIETSQIRIDNKLGFHHLISELNGMEYEEVANLVSLGVEAIYSRFLTDMGRVSESFKLFGAILEHDIDFWFRALKLPKFVSYLEMLYTGDNSYQTRCNAEIRKAKKCFVDSNIIDRALDRKITPLFSAIEGIPKVNLKTRKDVATSPEKLNIDNPIIDLNPIPVTYAGSLRDISYWGMKNPYMLSNESRIYGTIVDFPIYYNLRQEVLSCISTVDMSLNTESKIFEAVRLYRLKTGQSVDIAGVRDISSILNQFTQYGVLTFHNGLTRQYYKHSKSSGAYPRYHEIRDDYLIKNNAFRSREDYEEVSRAWVGTNVYNEQLEKGLNRVPVSDEPKYSPQMNTWGLN